MMDNCKTDQLKHLANYLQEKHPANVLMPGLIRKNEKGESYKAPLYAHKDGLWTWEKFKTKTMSDMTMFGILLKDMVVIDIDGQEFIDFYENQLRELQTCPKELTKKGAHYFFKRTKLCNDLKLDDGARQFRSKTMPTEENDVVPIDIKTVCTTGTAGFLVVTPSENKEWVPDRELWNREMIDIPDVMVKTLMSWKVRKVGRPKKIASSLDSVAASSSSQTFDPDIEKILRMISAGKWSDRTHWRDVGIALQNEAGHTYKSMFLEIAKEKCPEKFTTFEIEGNYWDSFLNPFFDGLPMTIASIKAWAKEDNPDEYCIQFPNDALAPHFQAFREMVTETAKTDSPYAHVFKDNFPDRYINCGNTIFEFNGVRLEQVSDKVMRNRLERESEAALKYIGKQIKLEEIALDAAAVKDPDLRDKLKAEYKAITFGFQHIRREYNVASILSNLKNKIDMPDYDTVLDTNPYLMGFENGIMDLHQEGLGFRKGNKDDKVTLSTGYKYFDDDFKFDKEINARFLRFISMAYPLEDEKKAVQEYAGYSLLGVHNEKKFAIALDKRRGFNGKSSVTGLLLKAFGPAYSCQPKASFVYKKDMVRDENDHSGGMLSFRHVRLMVIEELDPTKVLDDQLLKNLNGGGYNNRGRLCGSPVVKEFPWITKLIMCCNTGNVPHFDVTDTALIQRIFAIPHRARFYPDRSGYDLAAERDIPYSHLADSTMSQNYDTWRPYMMSWCIEGLRTYYQNRFKQLPASFREYAASVVEERNTVKQFFDSRVSPSDELKDYIVRSDLFNAYDLEYRSQQRDKKTRIDKKKFFDIMLDYFGEDNHFLKKYGKSDIFIRWKYSSDDTDE